MMNDKDKNYGLDELRKAIKEARKAFSDLRPDNGEWVEKLTMHDELIHTEELIAVDIPESNMTQCVYRFMHTFGEPE